MSATARTRANFLARKFVCIIKLMTRKSFDFPNTTKPPRCGGGISHDKAACKRTKEYLKGKFRQKAHS